MPGQVLDRHFARQMLPLAALGGLVVALAPPLAFRAAAWQKLQGQGQVYATHLAEAMRGLVARQPTLWRFDADKILQATAIHRGQADVESVRVADCEGRTLVMLGADDEAHDAERHSGGPDGWSPIVLGGEPIAWIQVRMNPTAELRALTAIAAASLLLGLAMGLLLYRFPTRVVRRQAGVLDQTLSQLKGAEVALTEANRKLSDRVEEAVGEVRRLSERVVRIQEEERRRIARDLHDSVGQDLTALQLELALARGRPDRADAHLAEAVRSSEEALREVRRVVHDLRPPELGTASLPEILRAYVERFEVRTGIAASFRLVGSVEPSEELATCLLRVLQEALTNVARHAGASEVGVTLELGAQAASLEVGDDGRGFDPAAPVAGSGLRGIRERCALMQGTMELKVEPGGGTRLSVRMPQGRRTPS
ncbi:MAG: sensor histidine kinase [Deltaproteobacteria bacterium]|nr:sensor histidine kinase [Deltaproteobacteria bacterium]